MSAPSWLTARPIAHRGLHDRAAGRIENSASSALAAMAHGFAIECDVQISADGEAFVFHDHNLDRLTDGRGPVRNLTAGELRRLTLTGSDDPIPTLAGFLDLIGGRVPLVVEIKSRFDGSLDLTQRVVEICGARPEPIAVKSFDPAVVAALRDLAPHVPRGVVATSSYGSAEYDALSEEEKHAMANLLHFDRTRPDFVSWSIRHLSSAAPLCRNLGHLPLVAWTVRTPEDVALAEIWADQIVFEGFLPA